MRRVARRGMACTDIWSNMILLISERVFLDEVDIEVGEHSVKLNGLQDGVSLI